MFWAGCIRESWEEIRLSPWTVEFLGLLPLYQLMLFERRIFPMVGWISGERHFRPNWEVERMVPIPMAAFLRSESYGVFHIHARGEDPAPWEGEDRFHPCFIHEDEHGTEVLWGATYHIVLSFLERVCDFTPPPMRDRPSIHGSLSKNYMTGGRPGVD
jgi:hypothetical protein